MNYLGNRRVKKPDGPWQSDRSTIKGDASIPRLEAQLKESGLAGRNSVHGKRCSARTGTKKRHLVKVCHRAIHIHRKEKTLLLVVEKEKSQYEWQCA